MRTSIIALLAISLALFVGADFKKEPMKVPTAEIGESTVILGDLRRPIGEEVTIRGHKFTNGPLRDCFFVESIDDQKLDPPTTVQVRGIADWPEKTSAVLRGYEEGTIRYLHIKDTNFGPNDERYHPHQTIFLRFEVLELVEPSTLKLKTGN